MKKTILLLLAAVAMLPGCRKPVKVVHRTVTAIPVDSSYDDAAYPYHAELAPIKADLDKRMQAVVGRTAVNLTVARPESTLSNWAADALLEAAEAFTDEHVDFSVVNMGGLRCDIRKGDITAGQVYELMPFDNELVLVHLKGNDVDSLCQLFARWGGQGISGMTMEIDHFSKAVNVRIGGKPIDANRTYLVATSDFLAGGGDEMTAFGRGLITRTDLTIRDLFMQAFKQQTEAHGAVSAAMDGRVIYRVNELD